MLKKRVLWGSEVPSAPTLLCSDPAVTAVARANTCRLSSKTRNIFFFSVSQLLMNRSLIGHRLRICRSSFDTFAAIRTSDFARKTVEVQDVKCEQKKRLCLIRNPTS